MAPMSPTYDRLEAGRPPLKPRRRFAWRKFALGAGVFLLLVWLFVPRHTSPESPPYEMEDTGTPKLPEVVEKPPLRTPSKTPDSPPPPPNHADEDIRHPDSFESDADPSKTTHCTKPHSSAKRLVEYGLMLDAGSTGSRIHIYKFNNCGPQPAYEYEVFKMTEPGLSSFAGNPAKAATSLDVLLDEAMRVVPQALRKCTPVAVKATAGLRLLPGSQSADILEAVATHLRDSYPFALPTNETDAVGIMGGADEGVFAWVTANYLLATVRADTPPKTPTYAVLDLGGGSTQIVFEPLDGAPLHEGEHKYDLDFGGKKRVLYQHSYLGYGLMSTRSNVHRLVEFMAPPDAPVNNVCLAQGTQAGVEITEKNGDKRTVAMTGGDVGSFTGCSRVVSLVLSKDAVCAMRPCAFGGVYQPALSEVFPAKGGRVLLLSYFYDRVAPLMPEPQGDLPLTTTVATIADLAKAVCAGRDVWLERWGKQTKVISALEKEPQWCLDLTFMYELLRTGYEFDGDREVTYGKQIAKTELGWCLGAGIKLVGGVDVQCRV
ncbi:nucleoside phosphatase family-domain-containing protein [Roridomyces roridus]|uniref:guanosine-diphosphatase n=1 Tax=Roridomyces roridus TaxID=1738132 RepID=A0AAD7FVF2_9AGAR|nr:nucleoside phosphatase family-domain-containing protein [Roridomyces roridus]